MQNIDSVVLISGFFNMQYVQTRKGGVLGRTGKEFIGKVAVTGYVSNYWLWEC